MRYIYQGKFVDGNGAVVGDGTISVFLEDGTTVASIYTAESGGSAVNSVTSDTINGTWSFFVDTNDYVSTQKFKITLSKTNYTPVSYDDIRIFPGADTEIDLINVSGKFLGDLFDGGYDVPIKPSKIFGGGNNTNGHTVPNIADDTFVCLGATQTLTNKTLTSPVINTPTGDVVTKTGAQTLTNKTLTSPTLTTPTIPSFTNATHDHADAAGGGVIAGDFIVKGWANFDGATFAQKDDYNVTTVADNGTGDYTVTWATNFATAFYAKVASSGAAQTQVDTLAAGSSDINCSDSSGTPVDSAIVTCIAIGDQ